MLDDLSPGLSLRPEDASDEDFLRRLYRSTRSDLASLGADAGPILELQYAAHEAHLHAHHSAANFAIVIRESMPIGRMVWSIGPEEIHLVELALLSGVRGRGIGTALLEALSRAADRAGQSIRLTVRKNNPARALYARMGFAEEGASELDVRMARRPRRYD